MASIPGLCAEKEHVGNGERLLSAGRSGIRSKIKATRKLAETKDEQQSRRHPEHSCG